MTQKSKSIEKTDECKNLLSAIVKYVCEYDPTFSEASYRNFNLGMDHLITKRCSNCDSNKKLASFEEASKPLIKWLAENVHPHHTVIVTSTGAELMMGEMSFPTEEFLQD
ncbi:hypothetical protein ACVT81_000002 [Yersinia enterocolitica]|uniref:hypothetical protein n=1 Tax=Yersinia intermedia TaxID=631 RepID=UPI001CFDBD01|nr:hypothetical protein [Yersinia intermedia]MCB5329289.1 hypothetical protein [Yersinia intermedia]